MITRRIEVNLLFINILLSYLRNGRTKKEDFNDDHEHDHGL